MAYYRELDDILNIVIGKYILRNQRLCKLLYYYPEEDVFNYNPLAQPDIPDTSILLLKHIFPMPKSPDIETEQKCLCGSCVQKLFQADPEKTGPEQQEQANPENDHMKGLRVNAFLRTPFYLNGKDFRFINLEQHEIMDLKPYIRHTVLHVSEPHPKTGIITVMVE